MDIVRVIEDIDQIKSKANAMVAAGTSPLSALFNCEVQYMRAAEKLWREGDIDNSTAYIEASYEITEHREEIIRRMHKLQDNEINKSQEH